jgi:hypothetical protein
MSKGSAGKVEAVIYAAKSTEDRMGSIETQLEDCRRMAEREGWTVIDVQQDEGGPLRGAVQGHWGGYGFGA